MKNERGAYWLEVTIGLFAASLLLTAALPVYAALSQQLSRVSMEWGFYWEMKAVSYQWMRGVYSTGRYEFDGYVVDIEEKSLGPYVKEGEITIRWVAYEMPQERKLYVYKMDTP